MLGNDPVMTLADILLKHQAIDQDTAKKIKLAEVQTGKIQEDIVRQENFADETAITKAKAELLGVSYIDLDKIPVNSEVLSVLSQEIAERFKVFPVSIDQGGRVLILAMADPLDLSSIEFVEQKTGLQVKPYAAEITKIETLIASGYSTSLAKEVSEALREVSPEDRIKTLDVTRTGLIREEKVASFMAKCHPPM